MRVRTVAMALALVALVLGAVPVTSARAHTEAIRRSTPADRSVVNSVSTVQVEFTDRVSPEYATFTLRSADGINHPLATPVFAADASSVTLTPPADLPEGLYRLGFQVTFSDGHPQAGVVQFEVSRDGVRRAGEWPQDGAAPDRVRPVDAAPALPWLVGAGTLAVAGFVAAVVRARRR